MNKYFFSLIICCTLTFSLFSQEFRANVIVNAPALQLTDPQSIQDLEKRINDFINNQTWTEDDFAEEEKIKVNIQFNIVKELGINNFIADVSIRAIRPVYGTDYETSILAIVDDGVPIAYEQYNPLEMTQDEFKDNLSSFLSYYLYMILGLDYDSFSEMGGQRYIEIADKIVNSIPPSVAKSDGGWGARKNQYTRYWLTENYLNPKVVALRKAFYTYHIQGLDIMADDSAKGRINIMEAVKKVDQVQRLYPNCYAINVFANTKGDELMEIFSGVSQEEKKQMHRLLLSIDPANAPKYNRLVR